MLAKLIIIVIIIIIFILLLSKLNKKEGFQTPTTSSVELNTECYDTEITNCVGDCNTVEKLIRTKCLDSDKCSSLAKNDCDNGCAFENEIKSNCEGKTQDQCSNSICVWNGSQNKCFEKNANYEKDQPYSQNCSVNWRDYNQGNISTRRNNYKTSCEAKPNCILHEPITISQDKTNASYLSSDNYVGACNPQHPCRKHTKPENCSQDTENECNSFFDSYSGFRCEPSTHFFGKISNIAPSGNDKRAGYKYGKKAPQGNSIVPLERKDCGNEGNPENFINDGHNNRCYSDERLCMYYSTYFAGKDPNYDKLFKEKCFSMKVTHNHFNLTKQNHTPNPPLRMYYTHSVLRDPSKIKFFSCEEIKKLYHFSKKVLAESSEMIEIMRLKTDAGLSDVCFNLEDSKEIHIGRMPVNTQKFPKSAQPWKQAYYIEKTVSNINCYDMPTTIGRWAAPAIKRASHGSRYNDTFQILNTPTPGIIDVIRTDSFGNRWGMWLKFSVNLKPAIRTLKQRIRNYNGEFSEQDVVTARTIIGYVENYSSRADGDAIKQIFSDGTNTKCSISEVCLDKCSNSNESECTGNSECSWVADKLNFGYCIRKRDETCNTNSTKTGNCSGNNCVTENDYEYRFCAPKLSCNNGEYLDMDNNGKPICKKCPPGTFMENGICKNCDFNEFSEEGSSQCTPKTTCPADSSFVSVQTRDVNIPYLTDSQKDIIKYAAGTIKDSINLKSDRSCNDLNKCSMSNSKYVTNYNKYVSGSEQQRLFNASEKIDTLDKHFKNPNPNPNQRCPKINTNQSSSQSQSQLQYQSQLITTTQSVSLQQKQKTRYTDYNCEDLKTCDKNQYISNYDKHKITTDDMYTLDRECADSTNCLEGTYEKDRVSSIYPAFDIEKNGEQYKVYSRNRNCESCQDNHYSNTPNATSCVLQPTCAPGNKVLITFDDFIKSNLHIIQSNKSLASFRALLTMLGLSPTQLANVKEYIVDGKPSINVFIHTESNTSGNIKYINESDSLDKTLFMYKLDSNGKLNITAHNDLNSLVSIGYNSYDRETNSIKLALSINEKKTYSGRITNKTDNFTFWNNNTLGIDFENIPSGVTFTSEKFGETTLHNNKNYRVNIKNDSKIIRTFDNVSRVYYQTINENGYYRILLVVNNLSGKIVPQLNNEYKSNKNISIEVLENVEENAQFFIKMKHEIPKHKKLECGDCEEYSYISESNHRKSSCNSQPFCSAGDYYLGDPPNRDSQSSCDKCDDNTYIENNSHRIEACIRQPILGKGQCAVNYAPSDTTKRLVSVDADGITNYQKQPYHRLACTPQQVCDKGQLINEPNRIARRVCKNIEDEIQFEGTPPEDLLYMDEINHRNQFGKTNPSSCPSGETHCLNDSTPNAWTYKPYKCEADCINPNRPIGTS